MKYNKNIWLRWKRRKREETHWQETTHWWARQCRPALQGRTCWQLWLGKDTPSPQPHRWRRTPGPGYQSPPENTGDKTQSQKRRRRPHDHRIVFALIPLTVLYSRTLVLSYLDPGLAGHVPLLHLVPGQRASSIMLRGLPAQVDLLPGHLHNLQFPGGTGGSWKKRAAHKTQSDLKNVGTATQESESVFSIAPSPFWLEMG